MSVPLDDQQLRTDLICKMQCATCNFMIQTDIRSVAPPNGSCMQGAVSPSPAFGGQTTAEVQDINVDERVHVTAIICAATFAAVSISNAV